jgi:hypothetical protein
MLLQTVFLKHAGPTILKLFLPNHVMHKLVELILEI